MRHLASIQTISALSPIPGADAIEVARVLGWNVVVKRGEFQIGDLVVYCEIDSLLPERPEFEFLRKGCYKVRVEHNGSVIMPGGFRIRTVKLRGQVSQGICFPLSILPESVEPVEDLDVTEALGIMKYDVEALAEAYARIPGAPSIRVQTFPSFIPRTDETRVQSNMKEIRKWEGVEASITEKLDGSSITIFVRGDDVGVCSRNNILPLEDTSNAMVAWAHGVDMVHRMTAARAFLGYDFALQGEFIGPKVQGNKYGLASHQVRIFGGYMIADCRYMNALEVWELVTLLGLEHVPEYPDASAIHLDVDRWVEMSKGASSLNTAIPQEGIVVRAYRGNERLSFKVINPDFLLKYDA